MSPEQFREFLGSVFSSYVWALKPGASMYVCHPSSSQREFQDALELSDFEVRCQLIWAKNTFAWGFGRYKFQHEPIFYCHRKGQSDPWYGNKSQSTLWQEKKPAANSLHPTMKPIELIERALTNSSKTGDLVLDLFGGSGSTMIASEKNRRHARLMELDPKYCDVIVRRWQEFTGKPAHLENGRTFAELELEQGESKRDPVNSAEFAESQGFSRPYVTKLVQQGVIVRDAKGQIDKDTAVAALTSRREPGKALRRGRAPKPGDISALGAVGGPGSEALSTMLLKSRIKTEVERGKLAELDRKQREGELVERSDVEEAAFFNARRVRDALMNIPARIASLYAAETDPQKIHQNLEDEIRTVLIDLIDETETASS